MRNFIALIISLCLVVTLLPAPLIHAGETEAESPNIGFLKNLGILQTEEIDGTELLSRMELAKMYYTVLTGAAAPDYSSYTTRYKDVTEKESGYIKVVSDAGIMNGTSADTFGTSEKVTYIQLMKTMVVFLGYGAHAELSGGWPYGYLSVASSLGLTAAAPADMDYYVTYSGAADIFRLAADADLMIRSSFEEETYKSYEGGGYLEYYMDITLRDGVVTASTTVSLDDDNYAPFGKVKIDGEFLAMSENCLGIYDLIGRNITVFVSGKSGYDNIVYFEIQENNVYEIYAEDIISADESRITYETGDKDEFIRLSSDVTVIYNSSIAKNYTSDTLNPFASDVLDGKIIAIDNNADKASDIIMIEAYETFVCGGIRNGIANSDIVPGKKADLSEFDEVSYNVLNAVGQPLDHTDIVPGDILNCFYDLSGNLTRVVVTIDSSKGTIEEIKKDSDSIESLVIAGKEFDCANSVMLSPDAKNLKSGDTVTFWFNKDKKIAVIKKGAADSELALAVDFKKNEGLDDSCIIKLFEANGKFVVYTLSEKVNVNGKRINDENLLSVLGTSAESGKIKRQMIKYSLNSEGLINRIIMADSTKDAEGFYESDFFVYDGYDGTTARSFRTELSTFELELYVGSDSKIFVMPPEADRDREKAYAVKNSGYFGKAGYIVTAYGSDKYSSVADAIIHESESGASADLSSTTSFFMISDIVNRIDENGDEVLCLNGFSDISGFESMNVADESVLNVGKDGERVDKGDIIIIGTDSEGSISAAKLVLDKSENQLFEMNNPNGAYPGTDQRFIYGELVCKDATHITIEAVDTDGSKKRESYPIYRFENTGALCTENERTGELTVSNVKSSELYDRVTYGSECSKVFVVLAGSWWQSGIIYN